MLARRQKSHISLTKEPYDRNQKSPSNLNRSKFKFVVRKSWDAHPKRQKSPISLTKEPYFPDKRAQQKLFSANSNCCVEIMRRAFKMRTRGTTPVLRTRAKNYLVIRCVNMYIDMWIYGHRYSCRYVYVHVYKYTYIYIYIHVCVCVYIHIYVHICTHMYMYMFICTYMCIYYIYCYMAG